MASTTATIKHRFQTAIANRTDVDVSATRWNDSEVMAGGSTGGLCVRDAGQTDGWGLVDAVATNNVLVSAGVGTLPTWSPTPTATSFGASSYVSIGTTPATSGAVRLANTAGVYWRNAANTADLSITCGASDIFNFAGRVLLGGNSFVPVTDAAVDLGGTTLRWRDVFVNTSISIGTNPATTGAFRLSNGSGVYFRNAANTADVKALWNSDTQVVVGNNTGVTFLYLQTNSGSLTYDSTISCFYPPDNTLQLGASNLRWKSMWSLVLGLTDGVTAPATVAGQAQIYVDSADGDLKVKFGDGVVKTIVVDT